MNNQNKPNLHFYVGLFLTLLNSVVLVYLVFSGIKIQVEASNNKDKLVIENAPIEDVQQLNSQIIYTGQKGDDTKYYSPSLDILLSYDNSKYYISENDDNITITESGFDLNSYAKITISSKKDEDIFVTTKNYYEYLYKSLKEAGSGNIEGLEYVKYSYEYADILDKKNVTTSKLALIKRVIDNKVILAEIKYKDENKIDTLFTSIAKVLNTIEISPKNIDQKIKVGLKTLGLELQYEKNKWKVQSHFDSSLSMSFISENEIEKEFKNSYTSINISGYKNYENKTVQELLDEYVGYDKESRKDSNFTFITENQTQKVSGSDFKYSTYSYMYSGEKVYIKQLAGIKNEVFVIIKLYTSSFETEASKDFENILNTFSFQTVQTLNTNKSVLGATSFEIDKATILGRPAVTHIFNRSCVDIKVQNSNELRRTSGKSYNVCSAGFGTGFYVSNDGYLITNGHVATPDPIDTVSNSVLYSNGTLPQFWSDYATDVAQILTLQGYNIQALSQSELGTIVLSSFEGLVSKGFITLKSTYENYIENGTPFIIDPYSFKVTNPTQVLSSTLVAGQVDSFIKMELDNLKGISSGVSKPDLAILKVNGVSNIPILKLSDPSLLTIGEKINVIGYPGSANNSTLFASNAKSIPTVTNGSISAIKPNTTNSFNLIQIDASISHGNSGGPVINNNGEVVAVATYGLSSGESADFNAGVSVEEVTKYLQDNKISTQESKVSNLFESAINYLSKSYYKFAVKDLNQILELYPQSKDIVQPLINIANSKINAGEDKSPILYIPVIENILEDANIHVSFQTIVSVLAILIVLVISTIFTIKAFKKRSSTPPTPPVQSQPMFEQPTVTVQQPIVNQPVVQAPITQTPLQSTALETPALQTQAPAAPSEMPIPTVQPTNTGTGNPV